MKFLKLAFAVAAGAALMSCGDAVRPTSPDGGGPTVKADAVTSQGAGGPSIVTDKSDYSPGDTVVITGTGWQANESVALVLTETPDTNPPTSWTVVADSIGGFVDRTFGVNESHIGVSFQLIATGAASADTAQGVFTDAAPASLFNVVTNGGTMLMDWKSFANTTCTNPGEVGKFGNNVSIGTTSTFIDSVTATESIRLTATAPTGMTFVNWTGALTSTNSSDCFPGSASNQVAKANFAIVTHSHVVAAPASPQVSGTSVTFTDSVFQNTDLSGATGNVKFFVDGTDCTTTGTPLSAGPGVSLASGVASLTTTAITVGAHTIWACYLGKAGTAGAPDQLASSSSIPYTITAASVATTTSVTPSPASPSEFGTSVTFTATVTQTIGGTAVTTGNVSFHDTNCAGTLLQAAAAVNGSGQQTYTTSSLSVGGHTIAACYEGATGFNTSNGTAAYTITNIATSTAVTSNLASPQAVGSPVTFTATVTRTTGGAAVTSGNVRFTEGGTCAAPTTTLQAATAVNGSGQVTFDGSSLAAGSHTIVACYDGFTNYAISQGSEAFTFNLASTSVVVTPSPVSPQEFGTSVTFTAAVTSSGNPVLSGNVRFIEGGTCASPTTTLKIATAVNGSGEVAYTTTTLPVGAHTIVACYDGTGSYDISSGSAAYTITNIATSTAVTSNLASPQVVGSAVTFTATVTRTTGGAAVTSGNVRFTEGGTCAAPTTTLQGATAVNGSGQVTFDGSGLAVGSHTIVACYDGFTNYDISQGSEAFTFTLIPTSVVVTPSPASPQEFGTSVTFTAAVTASSNPVLSGNVRFIEGGTCASPTTTLQAATAVNGSGQVAYTTTTLPIGAHTIVACYDGTSTYDISNGSAAYTITKIATTTGVTANKTSPQQYGTSIIFTAEVNRTTGGTDVTSGNVSFYDGGNCAVPGSTLQSSTAVDGTGKVTLTINNLSIATHNILACYEGDATYNTSYGTMSFQITQIPTTVTLSLSPSTSQQYSDSVILSAAIVPDSVAGSVQFQKSVNSGSFVDVVSPVTVAAGTARAAYAIVESSADNLRFRAVFTPTDVVHFASDADTLGYTVTREDAKVGFSSSNPPAVQVNSPGLPFTGSVSFNITAREKTPDLAASLAAAGNIDNVAGLTVTLTLIGGGSALAVPCAFPSNNGQTGYNRVLTYTCTFTGTLPVSTYQLDANVTGNYYTGGDTDAFTVYDPSLGFATGGGTFNLGGDRVNFGFTMKYNKSGANLQGNFIAVRHHPDGTVSRIKSNSLGGLALLDAGSCGNAQFSGKATYTTWDAGSLSYITTGNNTFSVSAKDCNQPGTGYDYFWMDAPGDLDMPNFADTYSAILTGGNIAVPHTLKK